MIDYLSEELKKMKGLAVILFLLVQLLHGHNIDSLKAVSAGLPDDTNKVNTLVELCSAYQDLDEHRQAISAGTQAIELAMKLQWKRGLARCHNDVGVSYFNLAQYPEALRHYFAALKVRTEMGNKPGIAASYNNIGIIYSVMGNFEEALKNHFASVKIKQAAGDTLNLHHSYTNIGAAYEHMKRPEDALRYHRLALANLEAQRYEAKMADAYINIGNALNTLEKEDEALQNLERAQTIFEKYGNKFGLAVSKFNMSEIYISRGEYRKGLATLYKARDFAHEAGMLDLEKEAEANLTWAYEKMGNPKEALVHYKRHVALTDSIFNEENTKQMVRAEMNHEFEKKEAATRAEQEKRDAIAQAEKRRQRIILFSISGFGLLALGFAGHAWRSFTQKKKANIEITRQKQIIEVKQKEILDSIFYARRIQQSLLTNERYIERTLRHLRQAGNT